MPTDDDDTDFNPTPSQLDEQVAGLLAALIAVQSRLPRWEAAHRDLPLDAGVPVNLTVREVLAIRDAITQAGGEL